ncbi:hypothetical protein O7A70_19930 [Mesorhizobium sp. Cs1299R1N1]|uniref:hypothetical protein n=1 Tax=Mesorhizobium sp. Cs1299R1N1 TaxID=3015172 RepID=UPI00301DE000
MLKLVKFLFRDSCSMQKDARGSNRDELSCWGVEEMQRSASVVVYVLLFLFITLPAYAGDPAPTIPDTVFSGAVKAIFVLFVLALVLESALAILFNWRPFIETFNARATRPLIAFAFSWFVVSMFNLDITTSLVNSVTAHNPPFEPGYVGYILTAMVIAGGSAGVNTMLVALGYRELKVPEVAKRPPPTKAWISIRAIRDVAKTGDIEVFLGKWIDKDTVPPRVGTITGSSKGNIFTFFLKDRGRFPAYGGFEIDPAAGPYFVVLSPAGTPAKADQFTWGQQALAAGGIVDVSIKI